MMTLCEQVHVYEYIPSMRQSDLCHYHERYYDAACTLGAYHPLLYEKSLIQRINTGPGSDLRRKGRVTLPGFSTVDCDIWDVWSHFEPELKHAGLSQVTKRRNKTTGDGEARERFQRFQIRPIKNMSPAAPGRVLRCGLWTDPSLRWFRNCQEEPPRRSYRK